MDLTGLLNNALSSDTIKQISQQLGAGEDETDSAIQSALPMLLGGLANKSASQSGASSLLAALDRDHDGSILDDLGGFLGDYLSGRGQGILSHIFGAQEGAVERGVSQASGLDLSKVGPLLLMLAPIVMGALGRARREEGIGAGDLPRELGSAAQQTGGDQGLLGALSSMFDMNRDGSVVDDIAGMLSRAVGGGR
ncbi:MAG TPA: DUF937 domain-containing protein [Blastocatellia bacterium]|nr:DUF937 domain-containing protein [Blastocatellia bacterium]